MKNFLLFVLALFVTCIVKAQWSSDSTLNTPVEASQACTAEETYQAIRTDRLGNVFVAWRDNRGQYTNIYNIYIQKFNYQGIPQWTANGVRVSSKESTGQPEIMADGTGGVIVVWNQYAGASYPFQENEYDLYAQRLSASGGKTWGDLGLAICTAPAKQQFAKLVSDGNGGAFICWLDSRNTISDDARTNDELFIQHVKKAGTFSFANNGIKVAGGLQDITNMMGIPPYNLLKSGNDLVVTWEKRLPVKGVNVYAQKLNTVGTALWGADGIAITNNTNTNEQSITAADSAGNIYFTWKVAGKYGVYVQKVNSDGVAQYTSGGIAFAQAVTSIPYYPHIIADQQGGAFVSWADYRNGTSDIFVQKINASGVLQFNSNGLNICSANNNQVSTRIVSDGNGGAIITWEDGRTPTGAGFNYDVYAQRVLSNGNIQWRPDGVVVSKAPLFQSRPTVVAYGDGGAIVSWFDSRSAGFGASTCKDVYIQPIKNDGTLGSPHSLPAPPQPELNGLAAAYCQSEPAQKIKINNMPAPAYQATVTAMLNTNVITIAADSTITIDPTQLSIGIDTLTVRYTNRTTETEFIGLFTIKQAVKPAVKLSVNVPLVVNLTDSVIFTATPVSGSGSAPVYTFATDRGFTKIVAAESAASKLIIHPSALNVGANVYYVRMKTSDSCYTTQTTIDSIVVERSITTGIVDPVNPAYTITALPNPFTDELTLQGLNAAKTWYVIITTANGKTVYTKTLKGAGSVRINPAMGSGLAYLSVYNESKQLIGTIKLIKR